MPGSTNLRRMLNVGKSLLLRRKNVAAQGPKLDYVALAVQPAKRLSQLLIGLAAYGFSLALLVRAGLGVNPWSVLYEGLQTRTPLSFGTITVVVGVLVLLAWIPLRQRPTLGTFANIVVLGLSSDLGLLIIPTGLTVPARVCVLLAGVVLNGLAVAIYVGARFGPGPRDGLMTGLSAMTGRSIRSVRTALELAVLGTGWLLGGTAGIGTVIYALAVGPITQAFLPTFAYRCRDAAPGYQQEPRP